MVHSWKFIDNKGTFVLPNPQRSNHLYFPLVNEAGLMSSVSPLLHGDINTGQHAFLTPPVSVYDLQNSRAGRNFWIYIEGIESWSATGMRPNKLPRISQIRRMTRLLYRPVFFGTRLIERIKLLDCVQKSPPLCQASADTVELMSVRITNISTHPVQFTPTASIPIFGRSADNLR